MNELESTIVDDYYVFLSDGTTKLVTLSKEQEDLYEQMAKGWDGKPIVIHKGRQMGVGAYQDEDGDWRSARVDSILLYGQYLANRKVKEAK